MVDDTTGSPGSGSDRAAAVAVPRWVHGVERNALRSALLGAPPPGGLPHGGWRRPSDRGWTHTATPPLRPDLAVGSDTLARPVGAAGPDSSARAIARLRECLAGLAAELAGLASREALEQTLCDRLRSVGPYDAAWFGRVDRRRDAVIPSTAAGTEPPEVAVPLDARDPVVAALDRTEPVVGGPGGNRAGAQFGETGAPPGETRPSSGESGAGEGAEDGEADRSHVAVPLVYDGVAYGSLVLYPPASRPVEETERSLLGVLAGLGSMALNATEARRLLAADGVVELDFRLTEAELTCAQLATGLECVLELESTLDGDGSGLLFLARDVDPDALLAAARDRPGVAAARLLTTGDARALLEVERAAPSIVDDLAARGAETATLRAEPGRVRTTLRLPPGADTGPVLEVLEARAEAVTLTARRERERRDRTREELVASVEEALTERQRVALEKAHVGGFFDWPRELSGKRLAASMDISPATYHEHLRAAERKVFDALFADRWRAEDETRLQTGEDSGTRDAEDGGSRENGRAILTEDAPGRIGDEAGRCADEEA